MAGASTPKQKTLATTRWAHLRTCTIKRAEFTPLQSSQAIKVQSASKLSFVSHTDAG
jgi:hypothetical protein